AWGFTMGAYAIALPLNAYWTGVAKCLISAFVIRSSACTINDILDRKFDAGVGELCCFCSGPLIKLFGYRPLPSGRISVQAATLYLLWQYAFRIAFVCLTERGLAFAIYPLLKRVTYWLQAWLGLAMNFRFITAWISVAGTVNYGVLSAAMGSCWCWTMLYDTIYTCQDIRDDIKVGVRSTAILFGNWIRPLLLLSGIFFVSLLAAAGVLNSQGIPFFALSILVGGTIVHLSWQFRTVDLDVPESCWRNFKSHGALGWIIWAGLMLDYVLANPHFAS
ncbi:UbiA prenyltransferase family, partial [Mycena sanguinolenta]